MKKKWSDREVSAVREKYESGLDDAEIAHALGRTVASVSNCRQFYGIKRPRHALKRSLHWLPEELEKCERMYRLGDSREKIAEAVGRTIIAIKRAIVNFGWERDIQAIRGIDVSKFDTSTERWRRIPGHEMYSASTLGRIMSLMPGNIGKILTQYTDKDGYSQIHLQSESRKSKRYSVHCLIALTFIGSKPSEEYEVAHNDGVPSNNSPKNLRWDTAAGNSNDRWHHDTMMVGRSVGSRHPRSKLNEDKCEIIRNTNYSHGKVSELARKFGVTPSTISSVRYGRTWKEPSVKELIKVRQSPDVTFERERVRVIE